jgi:hypothetical protein
MMMMMMMMMIEHNSIKNYSRIDFPHIHWKLEGYAENSSFYPFGLEIDIFVTAGLCLEPSSP